ncbi:substrate-binding domain-containing protein [Pararhizobium haloflavum]|uniref:substrate-binding domain-containing protein n=1 Tax=Pararhizobium haloflavum TaxID=2037914 RepID=UPI000C186F0B|nr:substrate-binding domain-containing protein [Pararhizobium haloflavum]
MKTNAIRWSAVVLAGSVLTSGSALAQEDEFIIVQSTTSTEASGLYEHLLPMFQEESGLEVRVVAVGTGQAINNAENCDGDVLLVHAREQEEAFVESGYGVSREPLMYNDFVIVGPPADPAGVAGSSDVVDAMTKIAESQAPFASRGDDSGTHSKELQLWEEAGIDVAGTDGGWYRETGSGMGETLNTGVGMGAYVLTDRATWINYGNKGDYEIAVEGDEAMFNPYGIILVSSDHCENVKTEAGQQFIDWMLSDEGQQAIADYKIDGQQLFFPDADESDS